MERIKALGNWLIILLLLVGTAVVAVIWPVIAQSLSFTAFGGGSSRPTTSPAPIVIPIPEPIASAAGVNELLLSGAATFAVLLAIVAASLAVAGIIIAILIWLGGKFTGQVAASEEYQARTAALNTKETEIIKAQREKQPAPHPPKEHVYGLDPVSFSLIILFFVALFAVLMYALVFPTGEISLLGQTFYSGLPVLLLLFAITIPLLAWRVRRSRLEAVADKDGDPAPWDLVVVVVLGLLVVGVGIGLMVLINSPA